MGTADGEPAPSVTDLRSRVDSVNGTIKAKVKYGYQRPIFLQLFTDDEIQVTADHMVSWQFLNFVFVLILLCDRKTNQMKKIY